MAFTHMFLHGFLIHFLETTFFIQRSLTFCFIYSIKTWFYYLRFIALSWMFLFSKCISTKSAVPSSFSFHHHITFIVNKRSISYLISITPAHLKSDSTGALLGLSLHQGFRIRDFIWPWMIFKGLAKGHESANRP